MVCLKCGYCCIKLSVVIVDKPELGITENNLIGHNTKIGEYQRCPHLEGIKSGEYKCKIHDYEWYKETPCFSHTQIEIDESVLCRMGVYVMKNDKKEKK